MKKEAIGCPQSYEKFFLEKNLQELSVLRVKASLKYVLVSASIFGKGRKKGKGKMASQEFIDGVKALVGKYAAFKVHRLHKEDDDPDNPQHGTYLYDVVGVVEKVEVFEKSKFPNPPLCVFVRTKAEYLAINLDRIEEVDDEVQPTAMQQVKFGPLSRPAQ